MIGGIVYRQCFGHCVDDVGRLPAITIEAADLPEDVLALFDPYLLDLGGTDGDPAAGDPIQYDDLRIEHDQGVVGIVVYNRAILLFATDSEAVRQNSPGVLPARCIPRGCRDA